MNALKKHIWVILSCVISVSALIWFLYNGRDNFLKIWKEANNFYLLLALCASGIIYVFMGLSLWETLKLLGRKINVGACMGIAFVSTTVNYLVSTMGVSGFALRAHLLGKRGVPLGVSVMTSIVISVLLYAVLFVIILLGSVLLLLSRGMSKEQMIQNFAAVICIALIAAGITAFFFNSELRYKSMRKIFLLINKLLYKLFKALISKNNFSAFASQFDNGIKTIHKNKSKMTKTIIYICGDWVFTILILYLAFLAVGVKIGIGILIAGFALGMVTTLIPVLPGGIGAMEIAMATVFSQSGIDWDMAFMAALIYRFVYYIIPGIISIFVYWGLKISEPQPMRKDRAKNYIEKQAKKAA